MKILGAILVALIVLIQYPLWLGKGGWLRAWEIDRVDRHARGPAEDGRDVAVLRAGGVAEEAVLRLAAASAVRASSSPSSRAFSIAITAWSANVCASWISGSVKGSCMIRMMMPTATPSRSMGTASALR